MLYLQLYLQYNKQILFHRKAMCREVSSQETACNETTAGLITGGYWLS
jgi:hypothetical protein